MEQRYNTALSVQLWIKKTCIQLHSNGLVDKFKLNLSIISYHNGGARSCILFTIFMLSATRWYGDMDWGCVLFLEMHLLICLTEFAVYCHCLHGFSDLNFRLQIQYSKTYYSTFTSTHWSLSLEGVVSAILSLNLAFLALCTSLKSE